MSKHKILFLNHTSKIGGAERSLIDFIGFINDRKNFLNIKPYLIVNEKGELANLLSGKITTYIVPDNLKLNRELGFFYNLNNIMNFKFINFISNYRKKILEIKPDLIYINSLRSLLYWQLISRTIPIKPIVVYSVRDILDKDFVNTLNLFVLKSFLLKNIDCYICNSFYTAKALENLIGYRNKTKVVYNPAPNISSINVNTLNAKKFLKEKNINIKDKLLICSFSRLSPWKNQEILLDALSYIPTKIVHNICILIFGEALFGEEEYKNKLLKRIRFLSQRYPVYFVGNVEDVLSFMSLCDVIVHTSKKPEPFGRVIVEGMSLGKIVLSSGIGGASEIIKDGINGFTFNPNSPNELAKKITNILELIQQGKDIEIRKRATNVILKLNRETIFNRKIDILKNLLERR